MKIITSCVLGLALLAIPLGAAAAPAPTVNTTPATAPAGAAVLTKSAYPAYLGGDTAYPLIETRRGTAWYLDIGSIYAELYNPPEYILTTYVVKLDEADQNNSQPGRMVPLRFRYNTNTSTMYYDREPGKNLWTAITPFSGWLRSGVVLPAGEAAFYLFFEEKFLGRHQYPITVDGKVTDKDYPLPAGFYELIKGHDTGIVPATTDLPRKK